jgi:hypothetical protein
MRSSTSPELAGDLVHERVGVLQAAVEDREHGVVG